MLEMIGIDELFKIVGQVQGTKKLNLVKEEDVVLFYKDARRVAYFVEELKKRWSPVVLFYQALAVSHVMFSDVSYPSNHAEIYSKYHGTFFTRLSASYNFKEVTFSVLREMRINNPKYTIRMMIHGVRNHIVPLRGFPSEEYFDLEPYLPPLPEEQKAILAWSNHAENLLFEEE